MHTIWPLIRYNLQNGSSTTPFKTRVEAPVQTTRKGNQFQFREFSIYPFKSYKGIFAR